MQTRTLFAALLLLTLSSSVFAYIDPGTGMLLWQGLIAAIGAILIFVRNPVQTVRKLIDRLRGK